MVLAKKTSEDQRFSFHWKCHNTKITHLCFADDLILFCDGSFQSASILHEALSTFTAHSGLQLTDPKAQSLLPGILRSFIMPFVIFLDSLKGSCLSSTSACLSLPRDSPLMIAKSWWNAWWPVFTIGPPNRFPMQAAFSWFNLSYSAYRFIGPQYLSSQKALLEMWNRYSGDSSGRELILIIKGPSSMGSHNLPQIWRGIGPKKVGDLEQSMYGKTHLEHMPT